MNVIDFQNVSKSYAVYQRPGDRLKELLALGHRSYHQDFWALQDVSFSVRRGETFCLIGENGSGKSTSLQLIAGILQPTKGQMSVQGRVSALLELGAGFNPEFSGRDNVYLNAAVMGLSSQEVDRRYHDIEAFAEIGNFIHQPVKTYSSGMLVRLAFAVAIHVDPEILLVDEALAVGDIYFRQRCLRKVHELRSQGTTILFVSHAIGDVKAIGDRCLWLDHGRVRALGDTDEVVTQYLAAMVEKDNRYQVSARPTSFSAGPRHAPELVETIPNIDHRFGDQRAEVLGIAILDERGRTLPILEPETPAVVRISVRAHGDLARPNVGFMMRNHLGVDFAGTNTQRENITLEPMQTGDTLTVDFHLDLPHLYASHFSFSPAIADGDLVNYVMCDWIDNAITLHVGPGAGQVYGYLHLPCRVELNARLTSASPDLVAVPPEAVPQELPHG